MKNLILFLSIMTVVGCTAQTKLNNAAFKNNKDANVKFIKVTSADTESPVVRKYVKLYDSLNQIAYVSPNKDTLYLPDDSVGRSIKEIWALYPLKKNPTIVFVQNEDVLIAMIRKDKNLPLAKGLKVKD